MRRLIKLIDEKTRDIKLIIVGSVFMASTFVVFLVTHSEIMLGLAVVVWQAIDLLDSKTAELRK